MKYALFLSLFIALTVNADQGVVLVESSYVPGYEVLEKTQKKKSRKCIQTEYKIQTAEPLNLEEKREIIFVDYNPRSEVKQNILMMPPTGGVSLVDRQLAGRLCKEGARVLLHYHFTGDTASGLEPTFHEESFVRALTAIRHMSEFIEGDYGVIGTSLGALYTSQAIAIEPRITKALFVVGGAPIIDIIVDSENDGLAGLRKERSEKFNLRTREEYYNFIAPHFRLDLLSRMKPTQDPKVWIVRSLDDEVVPTERQTNLIDFLDPVKVTDSNKGHVRTVVDLLFKKSDIVKFFLD